MPHAAASVATPTSQPAVSDGVKRSRRRSRFRRGERTDDRHHFRRRLRGGSGPASCLTRRACDTDEQPRHLRVRRVEVVALQRSGCARLTVAGRHAGARAWIRAHASASVARPGCRHARERLGRVKPCGETKRHKGERTSEMYEAGSGSHRRSVTELPRGVGTVRRRHEIGRISDVAEVHGGPDRLRPRRARRDTRGPSRAPRAVRGTCAARSARGPRGLRVASRLGVLVAQHR